MITIGAEYFGPELGHSPIDKLMTATMQAAQDVCGGYPEEGTLVPWVNVVFYVPGSCGDYGIQQEIKAGRLSRKRKLLLVAVLVSEAVKAAPSLDYAIDILRRACTIAAEVFASKGIEGFDLAKAEAIVDRMKPLIAEKFAALLADRGKPGPPQFYNYDPATLRAQGDAAKE